MRGTSKNSLELDRRPLVFVGRGLYGVVPGEPGDALGILRLMAEER
jgi:hypothetical protein